MNKFVLLLLTLYCSTMVGCRTTITNHQSRPIIAVTVPFDSYDIRSFQGNRHSNKFHVLLTNVSNKPVRVWQEWCSWGYYCLQFEIVAPDGTRHILVKKPTLIAANFPDYVNLQPGGSVVWNVEFSTNLWEDLTWLPKNEALNVKVRAIYVVKNEDNDDVNHDLGVDRMGVWIGEAMSSVYDFTLYGPRADGGK